MKQLSNIDDPRLVKALAHPLRVHILGLLEQRTLSPKDLAGQLDLPVENVAYHVRALAQHGLIKLERKVQVRGAVQHYYRSAGRPRVTAKAWETLPSIVKEAMVGAALQQIGDQVNRALPAGGFARPDGHTSRRPVVLDEQGFGEASAILTEALDRISALEGEARKRIRSGSDEIAAVAVALLFDASAAPATGTGTESTRKRRVRRRSGAVGPPVEA